MTGTYSLLIHALCSQVGPHPEQHSLLSKIAAADCEGVPGAFLGHHDDGWRRRHHILCNSIVINSVEANAINAPHQARLTASVRNICDKRGRCMARTWIPNAHTVPANKIGLRQGGNQNADCVSERQLPICMFSNSTSSKSKMLRAESTFHP